MVNEVSLAKRALDERKKNRFGNHLFEFKMKELVVNNNVKPNYFLSFKRNQIAS